MKCGTQYKRGERYTLKELKDLARARGIKGFSSMNMDALCKVLFATPSRRTPPTRTPVKKNCGTQFKRGERYTLKELKDLARNRGIKGYSNMNMDALCALLFPVAPLVVPVQLQYEAPDVNNIAFRKGLGLLHHQKLVLKWMDDTIALKPTLRNGMKGGIIQLDMGLGKTLIALYWILLTRKDYDTPFLVVCDKSLLENWLQEANKFFGNRIKIFVFYDTYNKLDSIRRQDYIDADLVLTTYNTVRIISEPYHKDIRKKSRLKGVERTHIQGADFNDKPRNGPDGLISTRWAGIFADEAQTFTNPTTKAFISMMRLSSDESWCLTGTPIRNSDKDMYSLMRFCGFNLLTHPSEWDLAYYKQHYLKRFIKSMDYTQANIKLPPIKESSHIVELDAEQWTFYQYYEDLFYAILRIYAIARRQEEALASRRFGRPLTRYDIGEVKVNFALILALFTRMRQICIIPRIAWLNGQEPNAINDNTIFRLSDNMKRWVQDPNSTAYRNSVKLKEATRIIKHIITTTDEKILIFSSFKQVLDLYRKVLELEFPRIAIAQLDGSQSVKERAANINFFKNGPARIFLITFKTGAQGLTLTEANHVIPLEPWWTPTVYDQAIARAHRIGQKKPVNVYNILAKDTIETRIMKICSRKQTIIRNFLGADGEEVSLKLDFRQLCEIMTS